MHVLRISHWGTFLGLWPNLDNYFNLFFCPSCASSKLPTSQNVIIKSFCLCMCHRSHTVAYKETRHLSILPYKMAVFYGRFWPLNIMLRPYPLGFKQMGFGGFQKGAVRLYSLKGCKVVLCQTLWKLLQVWQAVVLQPIKLKRRTAPFWKPLTSFYLGPRG